MKILHIAPFETSGVSGINTSVTGLLKSLASLGHRVGLLSAIPDSTPNSLRGIENIILLPSPREYHKNPFYISRQWVGIIKNSFGVPDLVHFHDTYIPFQIALARILKKQKWPYISSPRGGLRSFAQKTKFFKKHLGNLFFFNTFIKNAEAIHVLCEEEAQEVKSRFPNKNIFILPNGVDDSLFNKEMVAQNKKGYEQDDLIIGFIGRIDMKIKGIDILFAALRILEKRKLCKNLKFIFAGPFHTNNDMKKCFSLTKSLENPKMVTFVGVVSGEDKWQLLSEFDVFIHTSRTEGFSNSIIEAMAFKKPCVITPGTNMGKIIASSMGGWLCEESPISVADVLISIKENKHEIIKRGFFAQTYIKHNLTWSILSRKYIDILKSII